MLRLFVALCLIGSAGLGYTKQALPLYQVDMIIFSYPQSSQGLTEEPSFLIEPDSSQAIHLPDEISHTPIPYHLLPASASKLLNEYRTLSHNPQYQTLAHYSWLQPTHNQRPVSLPLTHQNGWKVEGTVKIRQDRYYWVDTQLLFSKLQDTSLSFLFSQRKRLKEGVMYYLDHPQAGILIEIHKIA